MLLMYIHSISDCPRRPWRCWSRIHRECSLCTPADEHQIVVGYSLVRFIGLMILSRSILHATKAKSPSCCHLQRLDLWAWNTIQATYQSRGCGTDFGLLCRRKAHMCTNTRCQPVVIYRSPREKTKTMESNQSQSPFV